MAAEGAPQGHETVAEEWAAKVARRPSLAPSDREAIHARRQRHRPARVVAGPEAVATEPILVEEIAVTEIGDAGAAHLAEAREGRGVGGPLQDSVEPVSATLEGRAVVRCPEKDERAQPMPPCMSRDRAIV